MPSSEYNKKPLNSRTAEEITDQFTERVGADGFRDAYVQRGVRKSFWVFLVIVAVIITAITIVQYVIKYYNYPTQTEVSLNTADQIAFPTVTICNLNAVRKSKLDMLPTLGGGGPSMMDMNAKESGDEEMQSMMARPDVNEGEIDSRSQLFQNMGADEQSAKMLSKMPGEKVMQYLFVSQFWNTPRKLKLLAGHQLEDMLLDCTIELERCKREQWYRFAHPLYGNCFSYNSGFAPSASGAVVVNESHVIATSLPGPDSGLELTLYAETEEYLPMVTSSTGFRIHIHDRSHFPLPEDFGYVLSPGSLTQIELRKLAMVREDVPYRKPYGCSNTLPTEMQPTIHKTWPNAMYSSQACSKGRLQIKTNRDCGCVNPMVNYEPEDSKPCQLFNFTEIDCLLKVMDAGSDVAFSNTYCYKEACSETEYSTRISSSLWPNEFYFQMMNGSFHAKLPNMQLGDNMQDVRQKILRVKVYFERLNYQSITETPSYLLVSLLGDIGGAVGLWAGLSILSIFQFLEYFYDLARLGCRKK